jgi:hypothetical protein
MNASLTLCESYTDASSSYVGFYLSSHLPFTCDFLRRKREISLFEGRRPPKLLGLFLTQKHREKKKKYSKSSQDVVMITFFTDDRRHRT